MRVGENISFIFGTEVYCGLSKLSRSTLSITSICLVLRAIYALFASLQQFALYGNPYGSQTTRLSLKELNKPLIRLA